jgi:oligopeptide transport system substrate-binding protein
VIEANSKQQLILGNGAEVGTLDPHLATGQPEHMIFSALFEGLVTTAVDNPDANAPGAASSWETQDFVNWTFHLRPEAKWSDGKPVTAHDFAWSYQRMLTPDLLAQYASMLYPLKNAQEFYEGKITDFSQVGVQAVDDHTLKLTLTGPMPYLLGMMKHYSWFPVPRHVIERFGKMTDRATRWTRAGNLVGNGPFRLKEWRFTHSVTTDRNPFYWDAATVKLNEIVFLPIKSDATEERAFRDGQIHGTLTMPLPKIPEYRDQPDVFHEDPLLSVYFYRINTTKPPLNDKRVRRALALAIDRESLIKNVLRAGQKPSVGFTPHPERLEYHNAPRVLKFDVTEARRLLAEAGHPDGRDFPKFDILINTSESHRTIAEAIQEMWKKHLNIPVGIHNQDWQVYLESQRRLDYSVSRAGWVGDYPDPFTFLSIWRTGDGNNETGWGSPRYDELLNQSSLEGDPAKRFALLGEAEAILVDELPIIPVYWYVHNYLLRPEVKGWMPSTLDHRCYKALWLENAKPVTR